MVAKLRSEDRENATGAQYWTTRPWFNYRWMNTCKRYFRTERRWWGSHPDWAGVTHRTVIPWSVGRKYQNYFVVWLMSWQHSLWWETFSSWKWAASHFHFLSLPASEKLATKCETYMTVLQNYIWHLSTLTRKRLSTCIIPMMTETNVIP